MFGVLKRKSCGEAISILNYVEERLKGKEVEEPKVNSHIHSRVLEYFNKLFSNERKMSESTKKLLELNASISDFDVKMADMSYKLIDFADELALLSESNLAVVEQTTASMNEVNSSIVQTTDTLLGVTETSKALLDKNNESLVQLKEINELKENVLNDADVMSQQIGKLTELAKKVSEIVNSVAGIADQTNMLALNASIEAARAGEQGKGFSVVAEEIRKLADDTKRNLEGMREFVASIQEAAEDGQNSMKNTIASTQEMSNKIDTVSSTMEKNVDMLRKTIEDVQFITESASGIRDATNQISQAMESSSSDAEKLSAMTQLIHEDAVKSSQQAKEIGIVDDKLSELVREMMQALQGSTNAISNDEFLKTIEKARTAHGNWMVTLKKIVDEMKLYPLQTNGTKCAFGHFYQAITVDHPSVKNDWDELGKLHMQFHGVGDKVINAVKNEEAENAQEQYNSAKKLSEQIFARLDKISSTVREQSRNGINLFHSN